jgi:hypothetical protein
MFLAQIFNQKLGANINGFRTKTKKKCFIYFMFFWGCNSNCRIEDKIDFALTGLTVLGNLSSS